MVDDPKQSTFGFLKPSVRTVKAIRSSLTMISITCEQCGRVAEKPARKGRVYRFCSRRCRWDSQIGKPTPIPKHLLGSGVHHALRGKKQSEEHKRRRRESLVETLNKTTRRCRKCDETFTPTTFSQRYCSGRCWNAVHRKRESHRRFKIPRSEYNRLIIAQDGLCAICGNPDGNSRRDCLVVDHNHETNQVRGLLCHRCNTAIGLMKDNPEILMKAIEYLKKAGELPFVHTEAKRGSLALFPVAKEGA